MTAVKICGLREIAHVMAATKAGADYLGMIFATQSSRTVTPEQAQTMTASLRASYGRAAPPVVGVFVNEIPERMNELADICGLDFLQLSGDEPWSIVQTLNRPVIKAVRVTADQTAEAVAEELARELPQLTACSGHCLVESHVTGTLWRHRAANGLGPRCGSRHPFSAVAVRRAGAGEHRAGGGTGMSLGRRCIQRSGNRRCQE